MNPEQRKPVIGLCGGIGAGKSAVAAEFARQGCAVIDSDRLGHEVLREPEVARTLAGWWGPDVLGEDGTPDRRRIAQIVFAAPAQKERLERLLHPLIARRRASIIREVEQSSAINAIVIDSPLLFESNLDDGCDAVVFVEASLARRVERLQATRRWDAEELKRRERWQLALEEKRARSDYVVSNDGPPEQLGPQVTRILQQILAR